MIDELVAKGKNVPKFYEEGRPDIDECVGWHMKAWARLCHSRNATRDHIDKLSLAEIKAYAEIFGVVDSIDVFIDTMQALDNAFIERHRK